MEGIPNDASYLEQLELETLNQSFIERRFETEAPEPAAVPEPAAKAANRAIASTMGFANQGWRLRGACLALGPELFFSYAEEDQKQAVRVCKTKCPVMAECREFAIATRQEHGVWGGLLEKELQAIRRRR